MIDYLYLRRANCKTCNGVIGYDCREHRYTPSICVGCKKARATAKQAKIKQQAAAMDCPALENLALRTHAEVGVLMGLSAEAVRVIELRALEKLRNRFGALKRELLD